MSKEIWFGFYLSTNLLHYFSHLPILFAFISSILWLFNFCHFSKYSITSLNISIMFSNISKVLSNVIESSHTFSSYFIHKLPYHTVVLSFLAIHNPQNTSEFFLSLFSFLSILKLFSGLSKIQAIPARIQFISPFAE